MGPPTTRARTTLNPRADAPTPAEASGNVASAVAASLSDVGDDAYVLGREAKTLRDATAQAITEAWKDSRAATSALAKQVNDTHQTLLNGFNESFTAVGQRIDQLPTVHHSSEGARLPDVPYFTGANTDPTPFAVWLRRFEDVQNMRSVALTPKLKAYYLIGCLDGAARDKIDELTAEQRQDYDAVVAHLANYYDGPHLRNLARRSLSVCKQAPGETAACFADRIFQLVRAANPAQDPTRQQERMLEEFVARLRPDIRYQVELSEPATFQQAVAKARIVEELSPNAEQSAHPVLASPALAVNAIMPNRSRLRLNKATSQFRSPSPNYSRFQRNGSPVRRRDGGRNGISDRTECYSCGGRGHMAHQCPSTRRSTRDKGRHLQLRRSRSPRVAFRRSSPRVMNITTPNQSAALSDACEKIKSLSLSLQAKQAALDNSEARISALLKRNDELASSSYSATSATKSTAGLPDVRMLMMCTLFCSSICCTSGFDSPAWLCPKQASDTLARIPMSYNCSRIIPKVHAIPKPLSVYVFRPNTRRYDTPASLCKIVTRTVHFRVNLFGARFEEHSEKHEIVTVEACKYMVAHHKCEHGALSVKGDVWATSNQLHIEWPSAPFGCCVTHTLSVSNCYLISTFIHMRHGSAFPDTSVGDMRNCPYSSAHCVMLDGSALIWNPNQEESCQYIPVTSMAGHRMGDIWISDSKEFALSWHEDSVQQSDCGKQLIITDQGYAVVIKRRRTRSSDAIVGVVTTNQLAAQLLAVEDNVQLAVASLFHHALSSLCDRTNLLALALHSSLSINPTFTMRSLLDREDLAASYLGNDLVQIHRCLAVPSGNYRVVPFNGTCYSKPQVEVSLKNGATLRLFIDPQTLVMSKKATAVDCASSSHFFFSVRGTYHRFDSATGRFTLPSYVHITTPSHLNSSSLALPLTIFHNLVLTNLTEITQDHQLHELWSTVNQERILNLDNPSSSSDTHSSRVTDSQSSLFSLIFGSWSLYDVWISICSAFVTFQLAKTIIITYISIAYPALVSRISEVFHRNPHRPHTPLPAVSPSALMTDMLHSQPLRVDSLELLPVSFDATSAWPPRASFPSLNILAIQGSRSFFVAQIPIKANNINILALIDTGAAITVTSNSTAPLLGVFSLLPSDIPSALGMACVPIELVGLAHIQFQIGSLAFKHPVYFSKSPCAPESACSFNIILGNDLLSRLPPWSISYSQKIFQVADEQINIFCSAPSSPPIIEATIPIRVAETTVLPPNTETFVPCISEASDVISLILTSQPDSITDKSLLVSPAVINTGRSQVLVSNPCHFSHVLYQGQQISSALPFLDNDNTPSHRPAVCP